MRGQLYDWKIVMSNLRLPAKDHVLIQIVDSALVEAARRSGEWLVCRPGCTQCCIGVFPINQLDAVRLRRGLADLEKRAPQRAERVRGRARESVARLSPDFPGDPVSGVLEEGNDAAERFSDSRTRSPAQRSILKQGIATFTNRAP
jgi:hypothetical protein